MELAVAPIDAWPRCDRVSSKDVNLNFGLYYYGFRWYAPGLQRWGNRDPMGEEGGIKLYALSHNNPIGRVDPHGLQDGEPDGDYDPEPPDWLEGRGDYLYPPGNSRPISIMRNGPSNPARIVCDALDLAHQKKEQEEELNRIVDMVRGPNTNLLLTAPASAPPSPTQIRGPDLPAPTYPVFRNAPPAVIALGA